MDFAPPLTRPASDADACAPAEACADLEARIDVSESSLAQIQRLYDDGQILQAHAAACAIGEYRRWQGAKALVLAGRLTAHLGAPKLSSALFALAWRCDRDDPQASYFYAMNRVQCRGPFAGREFLRRYGALRRAADADTLASWHALHADVAGMFRDFDAAEKSLRQAEQAAPSNPWVHVCRAFVLEQQDRYDQALEVVQAALALRPWYRPAVQSAARLLSLLSRNDEALALLTEAAARHENSGIVGQLYLLLMELKQYSQARLTLDRYVELTPLAEKGIGQWLAAQRSEIAYFTGNVEQAIALARQSEIDYFVEIASRLADPARQSSRRVLLPVGFVRQHRLTCGPATLAAIGAFWNMPVDHLQVAEEICYDGTPHYSERKWAEDNGWFVREFSVTEQAAAALLDRRIPFTFTSVEPANSHLQAVIGYDGRRGTLTIRDPYEPNSREGLADKVLARYAPFGSRGMALVPAAKRSLMEDLVLPDAELWDLLHEVDGALQQHRRQRARELVDRMQLLDPEHRLTCEARRHLAYYDGNPSEQLAAVEGLQRQFPDNERLQIERLSLLKNHVQRDELLAMHRQWCGRADSHPIFWQQYAGELLHDARRQEDVVWLLKRALRRWPLEASNYHLLAGAHWMQRRFEESLALYRLAAALDDRNERFAGSYFRASLQLKQTEQSLAFVRERFERLGQRSSQPATTLAYALLELERTGEALAVLNRAIELRQGDGDLLLYAADTYCSASSEHMPRGLALLALAKEKCPTPSWLRTAARLAHADGRSAEALGYWRELVALQPLATDAHQGLAWVLAEVEGNAAARAHLEGAAGAFPHHQPLAELWAEWVRDEPAQIREPILRRLLAINSDHAWGARELALVLAQRQEFAEAQGLSEASLRIEPSNPSSHQVHAYVLKLQGKIDEAREYLTRSVRLSVDSDHAVGELLFLATTLEERRRVLALVKEELEKQVIFGDGLIAFRNYARAVVGDEELLALLREAHQTRPDLWHAWSALIWQLHDMQRLDEAAELARQATEQFPLLPRMWLDRAAVERARNQRQAESDALHAAWRINPRFSEAVFALCDFFERQAEPARIRELLERAVAQSPRDAPLKTRLAETLWHAGQQQEALDLVRGVVRHEPGYQPAWVALNAWSDQLGCPEAALDSARELTQSRGGDVRSWLILARLLDAPDQAEQRLQASRKAQALDPWNVDAYDAAAVALAYAGRYAEATAECRPAVFGSDPPSSLRARQAWVEAHRGDLPRALELIRAVVRENPGFYGAWEKMCDWAREAGDPAAYLEAAEALVRIAPQYEVAYGFLGEARLKSGDRPGAIAALTRSLEIHPRYEFGGNWLFDLMLEDGNLDEAARVLAVMQRHHDPSALLSAREAILAIRQQKVNAACEALAKACVMASDTPWSVSGPVEEMIQAGYRDAALGVLKEALDKENAVAEVGRQWGALMATDNHYVKADRFAILFERGALGDWAFYGYIDGLLKANRTNQLLRMVDVAGPSLRQHLWGWGAIGMALISLRRFDQARTWQRDWRERNQAEPWMLCNVVEALRAGRRNEEAAECSRIALGKEESPAHRLHRIWLAGDAVLAEDAAAARDLLAHIDRDGLGDGYEFQIELCRCGQAMLEAPPVDAGQAFAEVRSSLAKARAAFGPLELEPARKELYFRIVALAARRRGTFWALLWHWWKLIDFRIS
ncbi:MAG TPA: tetratricopeptide repeat protein [Pirellulaceae bacterium]|nr:tetratricopeptide repeat protein [Pirellulaceae bacterium]